MKTPSRQRRFGPHVRLVLLAGGWICVGLSLVLSQLCFAKNMALNSTGDILTLQLAKSPGLLSSNAACSFDVPETIVPWLLGIGIGAVAVEWAWRK